MPSSPVYGAAVKPNGLATHVELPVDGLRTGVRFPPPPPTKRMPSRAGWHFRWNLHAARTRTPLTPQELNTLLRQAQSLHQAGRLAEAERDYLAIAEFSAGNAEIWHLLGVIAYQQGNFGPAIERYRKATELRVDFPQAHNNLAIALKATGQKPITPYVGSHLLRHSLATRLVNTGASLDEVSDVLRHRSRSSTMIYARLDIDGLRSLAMPWPVAGGAQ